MRDLPADPGIHTSRASRPSLRPHSSSRCPQLWWASKSGTSLRVTSWQLRYPVGPDAEPFLAWRARMSDEAWIDYNATRDDEAWYQRIARDFGLDARPQS